VTRGKVIVTGSVILLSSASHLQMRGVGGYASDFKNEIARLKAEFRGGVIVIPGICILMGGSDDKGAIRGATG